VAPSCSRCAKGHRRRAGYHHVHGRPGHLEAQKERLPDDGTSSGPIKSI
jgi:hypothetical protein